MVIYEVARDGFLEKHVKTIRECYKERRDAMLSALTDFFPPEVKWTHPQGGLFLWVTLPAGVDCMRLFDEAIRHNVAFVPGQRCDGWLRRTTACNRRSHPSQRCLRTWAALLC